MDNEVGSKSPDGRTAAIGTGLVMVTIFRDGQQWRLRAIGEGIDARIPAESIEAMKRFL